MKTTNMFKKIKYALIAVAFGLIAIIVSVAFSFSDGKSVNAASGCTFTSYSSVSEIKTNAASKEFVVYGVISNNSESIFGVDFQINIDSEVFEFKEFMTPAKIATAVGNPSLSNTLNSTENVTKHTASSVVCSVDNNFQPITASSFVIGGYKIAVKSGAVLTGNSTVTVTGIKIPNMLAQPVTYTAEGTSMEVKFTDPSNACDITNLTYSGITITKDGSNFKTEVPYSVSALNTANLKATVSNGATVAYSPNGNVSLSVDQTTAITITVTAEDGKTTKTATLNVTRKAGEEEKTLSALTFKNGDTELLSKSESDLTSGGEFSIGNSIAYADRSNLSVITSKNGTYSTVQISIDGTLKYNGAATETNKTQSLSGLSAGDHTLTVTVKSETGASTQYTVKFTIAAESVGPVGPVSGEPGSPDEGGGIFKPTLKENPAFMGAPINVQDLLVGFNSKYMELSGDVTATKAGTYNVTITLKNAEHFWKENATNTVKALGFIVPLADAGSFPLEWTISPYRIPVSSWVSVAGKVPELSGVAPGILACLSLVYTAKDGTEVDPATLKDGTNYIVTATVKDEFVGSVYFTNDAGEQENVSSYRFTFVKAAAWTDFFTQRFLGLTVWIWFVIAFAVLLFLIVLIVAICRSRKKKAEKRAEREEEVRKEENCRKAERQDHTVAQPVNTSGGYGMPMMGGIMPVGIQQPAATQPVVVNSSSEQLNDIKQELRDLRQGLQSQAAAQPVVISPQPSSQPASTPAVSAEQFHDLKQELHELRQDLKSQTVAQPVVVSPQPTVADPAPQTIVVQAAQGNDAVSADQIKDEVKGDLKEEFGHQVRVERFLETIATLREQDRQKLEQEDRERNERMQNLEARRKDRIEASEYHHMPYEIVPHASSTEKIRELEGKLHNMEEFMWMMRFGGGLPQQQSQLSQITSAKDESIQELKNELREMKEQQAQVAASKDERVQELEKELQEMKLQQQAQMITQMKEQQAQVAVSKDERVQELEKELHEMKLMQQQAQMITQMKEQQAQVAASKDEKVQELEKELQEMKLQQQEMLRREEDEKRFREMEERLRNGYPSQHAPEAMQPQTQSSAQHMQQNNTSAEKPVVVVQQPIAQTQPPQPTAQPGSVMTTTTTTTIDATKDAKASDLPDYASRFAARRRS